MLHSEDKQHLFVMTLKNRGGGVDYLASQQCWRVLAHFETALYATAVNSLWAAEEFWQNAKQRWGRMLKTQFEKHSHIIPKNNYNPFRDF